MLSFSYIYVGYFKENEVITICPFFASTNMVISRRRTGDIMDSMVALATLTRTAAAAATTRTTTTCCQI